MNHKHLFIWLQTSSPLTPGKGKRAFRASFHLLGYGEDHLKGTFVKEKSLLFTFHVFNFMNSVEITHNSIWSFVLLINRYDRVLED
jgi:hypothetical protein